MQPNSHRKSNPSHIPIVMVKSELANEDIEEPTKYTTKAKIKKLVAIYPDRAIRAIRVWMAEGY